MDEEDAAVSRMRNLLSSYYGIQAEEEEKEDVADIDSTAFDAEKHVGEILREKSLQELLDADHNLMLEIKALDSDMQMLVYENYNKFITATDTIRTMKHHVDSMDDKMEQLTKDVAALADQTKTVNERFAPRRGEIEKLAGVRALVEKLEFLFELPQRLARCIELEAYAQAVKYYAAATGVLKRYSHVSSFAAIQDAAHEQISKLRRELRANVRQGDMRASRLAEHISLLLRLGDPAGELRVTFLAWHRDRIGTQLKRLREAPCRAGEEEGVGGPMARFTREAKNWVIDPVVDCACAYNQLFGEAEEAASEDDPLRPFLSDTVKELLAVLRRHFRQARLLRLPFEADAPAGTDTAGQGSSRRELCVAAAARESNAATQDLSAALKQLLSALRSAHVACPSAHILDRAVEMVDRFLRFHLARAFLALRHSAARAVAAARRAAERATAHTSAPVRRALLAGHAAGASTVLRGAASQLAEAKFGAKCPQALAALTSRTKERLGADAKHVVACLKPLVDVVARLVPDLSRPLYALITAHLQAYARWLVAALKAGGGSGLDSDGSSSSRTSGGGSNGDRDDVGVEDDVAMDKALIAAAFDPTVLLYGLAQAETGRGRGTSASSGAGRWSDRPEARVLLPPDLTVDEEEGEEEDGEERKGEEEEEEGGAGDVVHPCPAATLVLAAAAQDLDSSMIMPVLRQVARTLTPEGMGGDGAEEELAEATGAHALQAAASNVGRALLERHANAWGARLIEVARTLAAPGAGAEAGAVSGAALALVAAADAAMDESGALTGLCERQVQRRDLRTGAARSAAAMLSSARRRVQDPVPRARGGVQHDIERLFQGGAAVTDSVEWSQQSVGTAILRSALKALVELVRLATLTEGGMHQVQTDVHYLRGAAAFLLDETGAVDLILDECLTSALERCLTPSPLAGDEVLAAARPELAAFTRAPAEGGAAS